MNHSQVVENIHWKICGDSLVNIFSAASLLPGTPMLPRKFLEPNVLKKLIDRGNSDSNFWSFRDTSVEKSISNGLAVFIESKLHGAFVAFEIDKKKESANEFSKLLHHSIVENLVKCGVNEDFIKSFSIRSISGIGFLNGEISVAVECHIRDGWDTGATEVIFSNDNINHLCTAVGSLIPLLYGDIFRIIKDMVLITPDPFNELSNISGKKCAVTDQDPKINSYNIVFAGSPDIKVTNKLNNKYRSLIYPSGPDDITSQSPNIDEFVNLGYGFGIIANNSPAIRLKELSIVIRTALCAFNGLVSITKEAENLNEENYSINISTIRKMHQRLEGEIGNLYSPTFILRHEFLIFRDKLMDSWFGDRALNQAQIALNALYENETRKQEQKRLRYSMILNIVVAMIAVFSLISVVKDLNDLGLPIF